MKRSSNERLLANLSFDEMQFSVSKIEKYIKELSAFNLNQITTGRDASLLALSQKMSRLIVDIFGNDTYEYYQYHSFTDLTYISLSIGKDSIIKQTIQDKIESAKAILNTIREEFLEKLENSGRNGSIVQIIKAYNSLKLHPIIAEAASQLFLDGHHANAIENAVKALTQMVRLKSNLTEDGTALMQKAFSPKNPKLKFNALQDNSDHDEQKGFMDWFTGTIAGLRNPRAHKIITDEPQMALEFIAFISLQAKLIDKSILVENEALNLS